MLQIDPEHSGTVKKYFNLLLPDFSKFEEAIPLFRWDWEEGCLKLYFVCQHRFNISRFFFEMIHCWLMPGQTLDVSSLFSANFQFNQKLFTLASMMLRIDASCPKDAIEQSLRVIGTEMRLGTVSVY